ncbi:MAG: AMIN domain-containing protein, partial [Thermodesulfobacteriota bacterium]|nr:AMIN domain-containing protein [Thermodesulfobacteriota bacterium]
MRKTVNERKMARRLMIGLILWAVMLLPLSAAAADGKSKISQIKVEEGKNETNIVIIGAYKSYRAFTLDTPARLVVDLEGAQLANNIPRLLQNKGPIISKIRIGKGDNRVRIVVDSTKTHEPFHFNIGEKGDTLLIKCWRPGIAKKIAAPSRDHEAGAGITPVLPKRELRDILGLKEDPKKKPELKKIPKYPGKKIFIDFYQADLHNVFRLFGEMTGKNFIVDESVSGTLTLSLKEVPWDLAMDIISDMKNLEQEERHDILIIRPKKAKKAQGELVVKRTPDKALYPARLLKKEQEKEQKARELILKAHNLEKEGKIEEALGFYEDAFDLWKENIDLVKKAAYLHHSLGHYARSYYFSKEALKLNTQDAEAALYAALSASRMDKEDEARLF